MTSRAEASRTSFPSSTTLTSPRDAVSSPTAAEASLGSLIAQALAKSIAQIEHHDAGVRSGLDAEDVHQFRVGIRRLRSDLRTFGPLFKPAVLRHVAHELGWLGETVGPVRDADVLAERLGHDWHRLRRADPNDEALLTSRLAQQRRDLRDSMLARLDGDRYDALRATLGAIALQPPVRSRHLSVVARPASDVAAAFVQAPWHVLEDDVRALGPAPKDDALHHVRILVKRTRYAAEAIAPVVDGAAEFATGLAAIQTVLGDHHDTVVAEAWLADAVRVSPEISHLAYDLIFRLRLRRARARAKWPAAWDRASAAELRAWM